MRTFRFVGRPEHEDEGEADRILEGTVDARYFFGKPVAGGAVEVKAFSTSVGIQEFATVNGTTNSEGIYAFELTLPDYLVGVGIEEAEHIKPSVHGITVAVAVEIANVGSSVPVKVSHEPRGLE